MSNWLGVISFLHVDLIKASHKKVILWALFALNILRTMLYLLEPFTASGAGYAAGQTPLLLSLAFATGFLFEAVGVNLGIAFGSEYAYHENARFVLLGMPLIIPLFWATFIYIGY